MPTVTYPGVTGVIQFEGANPVGISPGQFVLLAYVGSAAAETGTLVIGDGVNAGISFPNCFRQYDDVVTDGAKKYRTVRLLDRRYRLMMGFPVAGHWNQLDERKKLIPWTVASPHQLATMLAAAMGETLLATDLPGGLAAPENVPLGVPAPGPLDTVIRPGGEFYRCGTNAPATNTNPVTYWNGQTPAAVLMQNLCETYGRVFCPDPTQAAVSTIWAIGSGAALPAGGIVVVSDGTSITADPLPARIDIRSNPTRYTARVRLRAVGQEWDGTWLPWEYLSYAPARAGQKMRCVARLTGAFDATKIYGLTLNERSYQSVNPATLAAALAALAADVNADADPRRDGVYATVVGATLQLDHPLDGVEYELTTEGSSVALAGNWVVDCARCPITGPRPGQPVFETTFVAAWVPGTTFTVVIDAVSFTSAAAASSNAALADLVAQANGVASAAVEWAPGKLLVTGNAPGTAITVTASSTGAEVVTTTAIAGTTFTPKGFEKKGWPGHVGYTAAATARLSLDQAVRLTNEHWCRTYQVVTEDPRPRPEGAFPPTPDKAIPVPGYSDSPVDNRHRLVLQNSRPEPVDPAPERISVVDPRTTLPVALETYNGFATDKPNAAFGSIHPYCVWKNGLWWTGGAYLGNTPLRQRLPFQFAIVDPLHQVVQFDRPLFRILGVGADTGFVPAELVIECGCTVLDAGTSAPSCHVHSSFPGGPGPRIARQFGDIEDEVVGAYDGYHGVSGWTFLTQEQIGSRAAYYADGLAATYQNAAGIGRRYSGVRHIPTDGKTRVVSWAISGDSLQTAVGVNCEVTRTVLPLAARRRDENLAADDARALANLNTDYKRQGWAQSAVKFLSGLLGRSGQ